MNLYRTMLLITAVAVSVAVTPFALAAGPTPAELKALEIRGQALNQACLDPAASHAPYRAVCTYAGAEIQPTPAELKALEIRGQALNQACLDPVDSRAAYRALCTYAGPENQPTSAGASSSSGFDWGDFGMGAGAMLGLALLLGGAAAAVHYGRRSGVRPRTAS
jgi:uncharacterized protein (DUF2237 family)